MKKLILLVALLTLAAFVSGAMAQQKPAPAPAKPAGTAAPAPTPAPEKKLDDLRRRYPILTEKLLSLKDVEKNYVLNVLQKTKGNKTKAAEILGIDRTTLYRILEKD